MLGPFFDRWRAWRERVEQKRDLVAAVKRGDGPSVKQLLAAGLDPNMLDNGVSLLACAMECGHPDIVHLLLSHGATFQGRGNERFLRGAVWNRCHEMLDLGCSHGLDVHKRPRSDLNPLELAVSCWHVDMIEHLAALGATQEDLKFVRWFAVSEEVVRRLVMLGFNVPDNIREAVESGRWVATPYDGEGEG